MEGQTDVSAQNKQYRQTGRTHRSAPTGCGKTMLSKRKRAHAVRLKRGFDNIGSNRSRVAPTKVVPCGLRKDDVVKAEIPPPKLRCNSRNSFGNINVPSSQAVLLFRTAPTKTEGQYKTSIASDGIFLPCLRGGAEGGGVTNRGSNIQSPFPTGDI